jgi:hypothetical protein
MTSSQPWWLTWPPAEVAATILPLFSQSADADGMGVPRYGTAMMDIVNWFKTGSYSHPFMIGSIPSPFKDPDYGAVAEAVQVLEHAGLLLRALSGESSYVGLTRLGKHALQANTVRQHLGLSDAPPTA